MNTAKSISGVRVVGNRSREICGGEKMNLYEIKESITKLYERLEVIRTRLTKIDCTEDEARDIQERSGLLNEIEAVIMHIEDTTSSIEYRVNTLLGREKV